VAGEEGTIKRQNQVACVPVRYIQIEHVEARAEQTTTRSGQVTSSHSYIIGGYEKVHTFV